MADTEFDIAELRRRRLTDSMNIDDVTLGEVYRGMIALRMEVNQRLDAINQRLENKVVSNEVYQLAHAQLLKEVNDIKAENAALKQNKKTLFTGVLIALATGITDFILQILHNARPH